MHAEATCVLSILTSQSRMQDAGQAFLTCRDPLGESDGLLGGLGMVGGTCQNRENSVAVFLKDNIEACYLSQF